MHAARVMRVCGRQCVCTVWEVIANELTLLKRKQRIEAITHALEAAFVVGGRGGDLCARSERARVYQWGWIHECLCHRGAASFRFAR